MSAPTGAYLTKDPRRSGADQNRKVLTLFSRLFRRCVRHDDPSEDAPQPGPVTDPVIHDQGTTEPGQWRPKPAGVREVHHYAVGPGSGSSLDWGYLLTIWLAGLLLTALAAATMYVSFEAQVTYIDDFKSDVTAILLEALSWDLAAVAFAILGMATALRGRSALTARLGNLACVAASVTMNLAQANLTDMGSVLVWAGPPLLYAGVSDRIIVEIQQRMVDRRELPGGHTLWSVAGIVFSGIIGVLAWLLRFVFSPWRTITMFRAWYLDEVPYAPGRTVAGDRAAAALEQAEYADQVRELAEQQAAEQVEAAERRADEAIAEMKQATSEQIDQARNEFAEQVTELEAQLADAREQAGTDVNEVRERAERELAELREHQAAELRAEQERATREQAEMEQRYQDALADERKRAEDALEQARRADTQVRELTEQVKAMMAAASGRDRLIWAYQEWERRGDPRCADSVSEIVRALLDEDPSIGLRSVNTACNYLRDYLNDRETPVNGHRLAGVN